MQKINSRNKFNRNFIWRVWSTMLGNFRWNSSRRSNRRLSDALC